MTIRAVPGCSGKHRYATASGAETIIGAMRRRHCKRVRGKRKHDLSRLHVYRCEACTFYHIGKACPEVEAHP